MRKLTSLWASAALACWLASAAATAQTIDLATIVPICSAHFDAKAGKCVPKAAEIAKLDAEHCVGPGLKLDGGKCTAPPDITPEAQCGDVLPDLVLRGEKCIVERKTPTSNNGDYVGDCFELVAVPQTDRAIGYPSGTSLKVLSQRRSGDDRELMVARADGTSMKNCSASQGSVATPVHASDLIAIGAKRVGWTYGMLAVPFKYYAHDKSFETGFSIGPYFGRRWGTPGSAYTLAVAATLGTVKGEVRDAQGNITSTPNLQAFSIATGYMWDISKSPDTKAFKIGLFVGADYVGADNTVKYPHNRKPWAALQIGFDFTDN